MNGAPMRINPPKPVLMPLSVDQEILASLRASEKFLHDILVVLKQTKEVQASANRKSK